MAEAIAAVRLIGLALLLLLAACAGAQREGREDLERRRILVFSHTTGYRHASIALAQLAIERLIEAEGGEAVLSEDPAAFEPGALDGFDALVLLSASTDPDDPASEWLQGRRRETLQRFVAQGGGIVGIHAALDSHSHWPWYREMIGARFERHPPGLQQGRLAVADANHPATGTLPRAIEHEDEYYFVRDFRPGSRILLTLDPASIGEPGGPQPISWAREFGGARIFYTALGHTPETYVQPFFLDHLRGAFRWVTERRR